MEKSEVVNKLTEFNKFAEELFNLSFFKKLRNAGVSLKWRNGEEFRSKFRGPDDEAVKALCNDLRKFVQPNDTLRIQKLIPVYRSDLINEKERLLFNQTVGRLDRFSSTEIGITLNGEKLTHNKVFERFLYGRYSHRSKGTKDEHDAWQQDASIYDLLKNEFIRILCDYSVIIKEVMDINDRILQEIS